MGSWISSVTYFQNVHHCISFLHIYLRVICVTLHFLSVNHNVQIRSSDEPIMNGGYIQDINKLTVPYKYLVKFLDKGNNLHHAINTLVETTRLKSLDLGFC
jgi:hypothetical protein